MTDWADEIAKPLSPIGQNCDTFVCVFPENCFCIESIAAALRKAKADGEARLEHALALIYAAKRDDPPYLAVANACDHHLDRSGALLGRVRTAARALQHTEGKG